MIPTDCASCTWPSPGPLRLEKACGGSRFARIFSDPCYVPLVPDDSASGNYGLMRDVLLHLSS